jgi:putative ATP-dependent endonuclease of OLD family
MRLERVDIENYRAVRRLAIGFGSVTTIIGEHHCGKSSLLLAIETVLDPAGGETAPVFREADFHLARAPDGARADELSITLRMRRRRDEVPVPERFALCVTARRVPGREPETKVTVLDADGEPIPGADPAATLAAVRRYLPGLIIRWRRFTRESASPHEGPLAKARDRITAMYRRLADPTTVVGHDIESVMADVESAARGIAERFKPAPERPRSVDDLADTPQPLITDLDAALQADAGPQRQVALLLLLGAVLETIPPGGLDDDADPILLFDDIESNLHPIWLAAVTSLATNLPLQQVITTHSSEVLNWMPLRSLRRLVRSARGVQARLVDEEALSGEDLRRVTFHLRLNRGSSLFARCWVLVEGETEAWLLPEFARLCGIEFAGEGIRCVEFAQCGLGPLLKLARALGIGWVLLADGDQAGRGYYDTARSHVRKDHQDARVLRLDDKDIEQYLFHHGYADVIREAAGRRRTARGDEDDRRMSTLIREATKRTSKPGLALAILEAANRRGADGVPPAIRQLAESARDVARYVLTGAL